MRSSCSPPPSRTPTRTTILGSGLADYRALKGLQAVDMAAALGMTGQDLAALEAGALPEPHDLHRRVAAAYPDFLTSI